MNEFRSYAPSFERQASLCPGVTEMYITSFPVAPGSEYLKREIAQLIQL